MKRRKFKRIFVLILCVIFSMEVFAVALSDNDGSAFITKTEYDSIKNDFAAKLNTFNTSIDAMIDNAIYAYLAVASSTSVQKMNAKNLIGQVEDAWGKKILWTDKTNFVSDLYVNDAYITNISNFCMQTVIALGTRKAISTHTRGYCYASADEEVFKKGYRVLKKENGKITGNVLYRPLLTYNITYFVVDSDSTVFGSNISSWRPYTHWGSTQKDTTVKYWVGYYNNMPYMGPDTSSDSYAWRTVSCSFTPTDTIQDFIMAPNSTIGVSVWDVDDESISSTASNNTVYKYGIYATSITGGTNTSTTVLGVGDNNPLRSPDFATNLPWVTQGNAYNDQVLNLNNSSVASCKMKYGLPLAKAERDCMMKWEMDVEPGRIGWYLNNTQEFSSIPSGQTKTMTSSMTITGSMKMKKGDILYVIYLPSGDPASLDVKQLYFEYEA